ncbi:hypothetical protein B0T18DRAFT_404489 [Schizothecium vesticola]|uniref:Uncharacterized protein n=1 Tax=Schizothecium vesticola TaxID=314040 RepID=A0AA40KAP9_9PEZI|nr:hypothetical protein B0T18DRAFT_404489 [Schizothecium vesticola]
MQSMLRMRDHPLYMRHARQRQRLHPPDPNVVTPMLSPSHPKCPPAYLPTVQNPRKEITTAI